VSCSLILTISPVKGPSFDLASVNATLAWHLGPTSQLIFSPSFWGYSDGGHYNFSGLEKHHYYSSILKFAIIILLLPDITVFVHTRSVLFPLHSLTCGPHMSALSSTSGHLEEIHGDKQQQHAAHGGQRGARDWSLPCPLSLARGGRVRRLLLSEAKGTHPPRSTQGELPSPVNPPPPSVSGDSRWPDGWGLRAGNLTLVRFFWQGSFRIPRFDSNN
jgi:hypothetical protein